MKEEEKKGEESLPQSKVEVSSIDLNNMLTDSFDQNRKKYLPLEQLHKKTKNRNAGKKFTKPNKWLKRGLCTSAASTASS